MVIKWAMERGYLEGIKISTSGPVFSHLLFADDTFVFLNATRENCNNITSVLHAYCHASGQQVSLQKSVVYFGLNTLTHMVIIYSTFWK